MSLRADFPILSQTIQGKRLVYLDNGATTQKPNAVIERLTRYYQTENANIHRGVHTLSQRATDAFENARTSVARFVGAGPDHSVIFTKGTTEGINLLASALGGRLGPSDAVLITELEHHSNIVPWQLACQKTGARLLVAKVREDGSVDLDSFKTLLGERVKIAAFAHISNALGTLLPIEEMAALARSAGAITIIDGAQGVGHDRVHLSKIDCDAYVFSGHKLYGPTGVGALIAKKALLETLPPYQGGGDMILSVTFEKTLYNELPYKFEAGTPPIAEVIGLGAAISYLEEKNFIQLLVHEERLRVAMVEGLSSLKGIRFLGQAPARRALQSFNLEGVHPHDLGTFLDQEGIAVRTGHHCAEPVHRRLGVPSSVRASLGIYNELDDVEQLVTALHKAQRFFS